MRQYVPLMGQTPFVSPNQQSQINEGKIIRWLILFSAIGVLPMEGALLPLRQLSQINTDVMTLH